MPHLYLSVAEQEIVYETTLELNALVRKFLFLRNCSSIGLRSTSATSLVLVEALIYYIDLEIYSSLDNDICSS